MKKNYWLPLLAGIVFCIVYVSAFDSKLDLNGDNAAYLSLARSLAEGEGYTSLTVNGRVPASQFPWAATGRCRLPPLCWWRSAPRCSTLPTS